MALPLRVLLVDDSAGDAALLVRELRRGGYEPTYLRVDTAEAMAAALETQTWDVIFSDHAMPRFSAMEALSLIKARGLDLPFIIVSGVIGEETAVAAMRAGAHDYLRKDNLARLNPVVARELREAAERLELGRAEDELRRYREHLEQLVEARTAELASRNAQLLEAERARAELAENLNREINHRVKNNLAMMAGLLQMQQAAASDPNVAGALRDAIGRILAVASLHGQLQASEGDEADLLAIIREIARSTLEVLASQNIAFDVEGEQVVCLRGEATSLAVVANELITNAVKHGAPVDSGVLQLKVRLGRCADGVRISVWNSGNPVPAGFDPARRASLGLNLVCSLTREQLRGTFTLRAHDEGTLAEVVAPVGRKER